MAVHMSPLETACTSFDATRLLFDYHINSKPNLPRKKLCPPPPNAPPFPPLLGRTLSGMTSSQSDFTPRPLSPAPYLCLRARSNSLTVLLRLSPEQRAQPQCPATPRSEIGFGATPQKRNRERQCLFILLYSEL